MDFENHFSIAASLPVVWEFLLKPEQVAPCAPGAEITEVIDETHYRGTITVKLGPVSMKFKGELEMQPDEQAHTVTLHAKGSEARGFGKATANAVSRLAENAVGGTDVTVESHVDIAGRLTQFGRGIIQDVSNRLVREFANCLEDVLRQQGDATGVNRR